MVFIIMKYLCSAAVICLASELAKKSDKIGALIASLPMVTLLVMFWLYFEKASTEKISNHAFLTFWYVLPSLPMFLLFPYLLKWVSFWQAILISIGVTLLCFTLLFTILKKFQIELL